MEQSKAGERSCGLDFLARSTSRSIAKADNTPLLNTGYGYNAANLRNEATVGDRTWEYGYHATTNELTSAVRKLGANADPGQSYAYSYDGIGNRQSSGVLPAGVTTYGAATTTNGLGPIQTPASFALTGSANAAATLTTDTGK